MMFWKHDSVGVVQSTGPCFRASDMCVRNGQFLYVCLGLAHVDHVSVDMGHNCAYVTFNVMGKWMIMNQRLFVCLSDFDQSSMLTKSIIAQNLDFFWFIDVNKFSLDVISVPNDQINCWCIGQMEIMR